MVVKILILCATLFASILSETDFKINNSLTRDDLINIGRAAQQSIIAEYLKSSETLEAKIEKIDQLKISSEIQRRLFNVTSRDEAEDNTCEQCQSLIDVILVFKQIGADVTVLSQVAIGLCNEYEMATPRTCQGLVNLNAPIIFFIIDERPERTAGDICGVVFQAEGCRIDSQYTDFYINVDDNRPPPTESKLYIPDAGPDPLRIVHISDPHADPSYREGHLTNCGEPACCRLDQGIPEDPADGAGRWGDYRGCDSPWEAVEDAMISIRNQHEKIDYVYFTGDIIDHFWQTSFARNRQSIMRLYTLLKQVFHGIPIIPAIGNHEAHPSNLFALGKIEVDRFSTSWLYDLMAEEWSDLLTPDALVTVKYGGYYTQIIRPGLRVIVLNNNHAYTNNFWLLYDPQYLAEQLQWLSDWLLHSESVNEKVHILGHIPPNARNILNTYSRQYQRLIERFYDTISGQFNGHSHRDEFVVFTLRDDPQIALNVAWNAGSVTTYTNVNPNYRIYSVENETYQVVDHETWIYNLTEANLTPNQSPQWFQEYSFKNEYGLTDLSPGSLNKFLEEEFVQNKSLIYRYWMLKVKMGDASLSLGCDDWCLVGHLCDIVRYEFGNTDRCDQLTPLFQWD